MKKIRISTGGVREMENGTLVQWSGYEEVEVPEDFKIMTEKEAFEAVFELFKDGDEVAPDIYSKLKKMNGLYTCNNSENFKPLVGITIRKSTEEVDEDDGLD